MKDLQEIKKALEKHRTTIEKQFKIKSLGLFGSFVRGEQRKGSDLDVLVEFSEPVGFFTFLDLEEYLSNILGVSVDLVSRKALKPRIGQHILEELIPV
jgi:predicted nucleotidyltransferase